MTRFVSTLILVTAIFWLGNTPVLGYETEHCLVTAAYSPRDDIQALILTELDKARQWVHLSLFGISNPALADKLIELHRRGVNIQLGVDNRQSKIPSSLVSQLIQAGIPVTVKPSPTLEHHKYALIDGKTLVMGSWNWSRSAQAQDNSEVILRGCPRILNDFETGFQMIQRRDRVMSEPLLR